jgi:hypothetical protein
MNKQQLIKKLQTLKKAAEDLNYELWTAEEALIDLRPDTFTKNDTDLSSAAIDMDEVAGKINGIINQLTKL